MKVISKNDVICSLGRCHQWEESRISRLLCWVYRGKLPQHSRRVIRSVYYENPVFCRAHE